MSAPLALWSVQLLVLWLLLFFCFQALGRVFARLLGIELRAFAAFWAGLAAVLIVLQWWNLVLPVGPLALCVFGLGALAAMVVTFRRPRATSLWWLLGLPVVLWLAGRSLQLCDMQDSGVYHLGAVLWAAQYPVVPGIANLHPFLGVSHGFFPLAALVSQLPFSLPIEHVPNGLFVVALGGRLAELASSRRAFAWASIGLVPALLAVAQSPEVSTASSDVLELALGGAFICSWVEAFGEGQPDSGGFLVCVLLVVGVVVTKFSSVGALAGVMLVALMRRERARAMLVAACGLVPWAVAGVLRTGVLPYPGAVVRFGVDWRVPDSVIHGLMKWTLAAGRKTIPWDADGGAWLLPRLEQLLVEFEGFSLPLLGGLALMVVASPWWWRDRTRVLALWLPVLAAVALWLGSSPLLRYSGAWVQSAFVVGLVVAAPAPRFLRLAGVLVIFLRAASLLSELDLSIHPITTLERPAEKGTWQVNERGLRAFVPASGLCWSAPLPCASFLDPELELRDPTSLRAGFRFKGDLSTIRPASLALFPPPTQHP